MFDPDSPEKDWRNRSLLSLQPSQDTPRGRSRSLLSTTPGVEGNETHRAFRRRRDRGSVDVPESLLDTERMSRSVREEPMPREESGPRTSLAGRLKARFGPSRQADNDARHIPTAERARTQAAPAHDTDRDSIRQDEEAQYRRHVSGDTPYWRPLIDPFAVIAGVARSKRLIAACTITGAAIGVMVALSTPKEYHAAIELLFDPRDLQIVERELTGGGLPSDATLALIENQVGIITSGAVLNKVVDELDLEGDPEFNGQGGGGLLSFVTNPRSLFSFGGGAGNDAQRRRSLAVRNLAKSLDVGRRDKTFIITIGATTREPEKSVLIATTVADVFLRTHGELQASTAGRANSELTAQLDELRAEVERAERAVADFKAKNDIVDAQGRLITEDEIVRLNDQLGVARARTAELNARAETARDLDVDAVLGGALPEQVASPVMTELLAQYASLKQQSDRAAARLGPRHPDRLDVQAELAASREEIGRELRRVIASIQVELQRAVKLEQDLAARLARLKVQKADLEGERVDLRELEREAAARRAVYESFLLRARETGQQRDLNTANVSIISPAYPPLLPTGPSRASISIAGTILGFLLGVGLGAGRGAYYSLRENMGPAGSAPSHSPSGPNGGTPPQKREREGSDNEFDPLPIDPPASPRGPSPFRSSARAHHNDDAWNEPSLAYDPVERVRADLRAFRREVEDLAARRERRRYG